MSNENKRYTAIVHNIDLELLQEQKIGLVDVISDIYTTQSKREDVINGVLTLLDAITDNIQDKIEYNKPPTEIGIIASIISFNLFTEIQNLYGGTIKAHEKIQDLAMIFETEHLHVKDWNSYSTT